MRTLLYFVLICIYMSLAIPGLHWYKIIIPPIQSSREDLDSQVNDSDLWKCQKWAHAMDCFTAPLSYTIICMCACVPSLLHSRTRLPVSWCIMKKEERIAICSVLLLPKFRGIETARQSSATTSFHLGNTRECKWEDANTETHCLQISPRNKNLEEPGVWDSLESKGKMNICKICLQLW